MSKCPKKNPEEHDDTTPRDTVSFWSTDPNILFHPTYVMEFFPTESMTYNQQMNAISRSVVLLTLAGLLVSTYRIRMLGIGMVTLLVLFLVHDYQSGNTKKTAEGFDLDLNLNQTSPALDTLVTKGMPIAAPGDVFQEPSPENPFSNVMMSDYDYNPQKKPAPPASNPAVNQLIMDQARRMVEQNHPDQPDISQKLFKDVNEQINFEQSMRPFYSNPGTTIPNDQGAFADFCYGSMISCKEGNMFACARNTSHYTNY